MKIDWTPSPAIKQFASYIHSLREENLKWEEISIRTKKHRTYLIALHKWFLEQEAKETQKPKESKNEKTKTKSNTN